MSKIEGLKFAAEHSMTKNEINIYLSILNGKNTIKALSEDTGIANIHTAIKMMKLKKLIDVIGKTETGEHTYAVME